MTSRIGVRRLHVMGGRPADRWPRRGASSLLVLILIAVVVVLVGVIIAIVLSRSPADPSAGAPSRATTVPADKVEKREEAEQEGVKASKPSAPVDTTRLAQTYVPGKTYRSLVRFTANGQGTHKDWGVTKEATLAYAGEMEVTRFIESNDGTTIVLVQEFQRARNLYVTTTIDKVRFDLGPAGGMVIGAADLAGSAWAGLPRGWAAVTTKTLESLADLPATRQIMSQVATDQAAKAWAYVDQLEGQRVRITYVNGKGVQSLQPLGKPLSHEAKQFIYAMSLASDAYVLPDVKSPIGTTWRIFGSDLLPIIDPSMHASLSGSIGARRMEDIGSDPDRKANIQIVDGLLELQDYDHGNAYLGKWAPTGRMEFSFKDGVVSRAELGGVILFDGRSTNHVFFEARFTVKPKYDVVYACEVLQ
jgi:flagellar basal body-associated protein FliL